ncbi:hypothetical protein FACS189449_01930 [Alphaproteobacteria bacterium]|nr:hypothetical protein FACS189449_01930 [Alphaproteobacteria bacterium]
MNKTICAIKGAICMLSMVAVALLSAADKAKLNEELFAAIRGKDSDAVQQLLERGAEATAIDSSWTKYGLRWTALHIAVMGSSSQIIASLISRGANVNEKNHNLATPLHLVRRPEYVPFLLGVPGVLVNEKDKDGITPLVYYAGCGNLGIVNALLADDRVIALVNTPDENGRTPLHYAAKEGKHEVVNALLASGADADTVDVNNQTAFDLASAKYKEYGGKVEELHAIRNAPGYTREGYAAAHDINAYGPQHAAFGLNVGASEYQHDQSRRAATYKAVIDILEPITHKPS